MTRGKQKIEAQKRNAERNQKPKGSQFEARAVALKASCPICKVQLANQNQLADHYASKHPKDKPPILEIKWVLYKHLKSLVTTGICQFNNKQEHEILQDPFSWKHNLSGCQCSILQASSCPVLLYTYNMKT
ncbi:hypothetical protein J5N97_018890 [Dioscorea zingiberensis]|uniref:C2H2-type domain-containing protein n=1 Tax=Dioscorea zingiberensis TaxID=325984 RepID=A0A9D5CD38_9LILI|nr:hypothetical protein J5N97_018890 [Dioscorea zingiberensis]